MPMEIFEKIFKYGNNYTKFLCMRNKFKIQKRFNLERKEEEDSAYD